MCIYRLNINLSTYIKHVFENLYFSFLAYIRAEGADIMPLEKNLKGQVAYQSQVVYL